MKSKSEQYGEHYGIKSDSYQFNILFTSHLHTTIIKDLIYISEPVQS